uniref:hypothetical chloroplast RF20 n=1 Tax=Massjukichlorella minus TaxID=2650457 RepID=UPI002410F9D7|nr:hypothetical chloroplast RF20 [Massjukichlorella minus]WDY13012.1 hypothetical chloroplast RF20 [Massjukichlorella minus]
MFSTRLYAFMYSFILFLNERSLYLRKNFTGMLCLLLIGFLVGNLFGTILNTIRNFLFWDGFIILFLIFFIEILSYATYHPKNRPFFFFLLSPKKLNKSFWQFFNLFKLGLMIGFFIDAFKVGS